MLSTAFFCGIIKIIIKKSPEYGEKGKGEPMDRQNLTLLTDLYELTMMQGYFRNKAQNETVIFDAFYRNNPGDGGYAIACGLEQVIQYVQELHFSEEDIEYLRSLHIFEEDFLAYLADFHFSGDIYAIPEGTVIFPREPLVKVVAPIMEAQLMETAILNIINHQSLIATKAARVCHAARGDGIMEFGLRRAQGPDAGTYGARAAVIGGCIGTSNVLCGQLFDVPVKGTHAHSWIMSFPDEYSAFKAYADMYPDACILLVDTYDTLKSGVPNAIKVFTEMREAGIPLTFYGIRLDSGDLPPTIWMSFSLIPSKSRVLLSPPGALEPTSLPVRTALPSVVYTNLPPFRHRTEVSSRKLSFRKIPKKSPIPAIKKFTGSMKKNPVKSKPILFAWKMRSTMNPKISCCLTLWSPGKRLF